MINNSRDSADDVGPTMVVPKETIAHTVSTMASDALSSHAGRVAFGGGIGTILGGVSGTDVIIIVGIVASVLGVIFGVRREIRETRKYKAEIAWMKQQGAKIEE